HELEDGLVDRFVPGDPAPGGWPVLRRGGGAGQPPGRERRPPGGRPERGAEAGSGAGGLAVLYRGGQFPCLARHAPVTRPVPGGPAPRRTATAERRLHARRHLHRRTPPCALCCSSSRPSRSPAPLPPSPRSAPPRRKSRPPWTRLPTSSSLARSPTAASSRSR